MTSGQATNGMNAQTLAAVDQLSCLLPLKERQERLAPSLRALHRAILQAFATAGAPPTRQQIAARADIADVDAALGHLADDDLVVLTPDRREIAGAYPFTVEAREHAVRVNGHDVHAMCALDALSVAPMFGTETRIESRCRVTGEPIRIHMQDARVLSAQPDTPWVGIRWQSTSGCAAQSLCMEMVFLRDRDTAEGWRDADSANTSIFDLPQAIRFGAAFFRPLVA